jgi:glycine oxidase
VNSASQIDLIIVGQGLAGSAVAMQCLQRGYKIIVLDETGQNQSSFIAAGLFNPVTGKNMVKTWLADAIFPCLFKFYSEVERLTQTSFFHPKPLYRPFATVEEQNEWMSKSADDAYRNYVSQVSSSRLFNREINDPYGGVTLKQTGYLDTKAYLEAVRTFLVSRGVFRKKFFEEDKLEIGSDSVRYEDFTANRIIFCQGVQNSSNSWFRKFPVRPLKGEFLTMQCEWRKDVILNKGVYMVPARGKNEWRVGATYNWNDHLPEITTGAKNELTHKLEDLIHIPYTITGQEWGVRPTTPDRKPILGAHPEHNSLIIFNGFGTKGVSLAPYFSEVLIRWMENKGTIHKEADVTRFN